MLAIPVDSLDYWVHAITPMTKTTTLQKRAATSQEPEMLPASTEIPSDVHAQVTAEAARNERSFAAQLRLIVKAWATSHSAGNR